MTQKCVPTAQPLMTGTLYTSEQASNTNIPQTAPTQKLNSTSYSSLKLKSSSHTHKPLLAYLSVFLKQNRIRKNKS